MSQSNFIKAAYGMPHDRVPIWIMRQAGRYLPEYRAIREKVSFLELCNSPELISEVTRQPIDIFGFDAAIVFSDILLPLDPLGQKLSYDNGGPRLRGEYYLDRCDQNHDTAFTRHYQGVAMATGVVRLEANGIDSGFGRGRRIKQSGLTIQTRRGE